MQDPKMLKQHKQKSKKTISSHDQANYLRVLQQASPPTLPLKTLPKASNKGVQNTGLYYRPQQSSRSTIQQESPVANEYRALRRNFLELEEESCNLGNEVLEAEYEIKTLEDEKHQLLDQLLVLEGLVDPSEVQS